MRKADDSVFFGSGYSGDIRYHEKRQEIVQPLNKTQCRVIFQQNG